jgi:patatin-like phospholipase/acyl hydrolase
MTKKILAIDGGGIRGIIPALILTEIEKRTGKHIFQMFDMIAGTSTGGILTCGLSCPEMYSALSLSKLYINEGHNIFNKSFKYSLSSLFGFFGPKYTGDGLKTVLKKYFGEYKLSQSSVDILVTSYEIQSRESFFFKSWKAKQDVREDFALNDVAQATASGPVYFPPTRIDYPKPNESASTTYHCLALVDGGVCANNPAMCAYVEALKHYNTEDVLVVSLGTGSNAHPLDYQKVEHWGAKDWLTNVLNIFESAGDSVNYELSQILDDDKYYRLQMPCDVEMDDISKIPDLQIVASKYIQENSNTIDKICKLIVV